MTGERDRTGHEWWYAYCECGEWSDASLSVGQLESSHETHRNAHFRANNGYRVLLAAAAGAGVDDLTRMAAQDPGVLADAIALQHMIVTGGERYAAVAGTLRTAYERLATAGADPGARAEGDRGTHGPTAPREA